MYWYIFNNYFPDSGGFSKRCQTEIDYISKKNKVIIICRGKQNSKSKSITSAIYKNNKIYYFYPLFKLNNKIVNYNKNLAGFNEIIRNLGLTISLFCTLLTVLKENKNENINLYTVVSPLTIPFVSYIFAKIFNLKRSIVEFHDLEPEMAIHTKNLTNNSLILKIEYLLEKIIINNFNHIIVTSATQANRIFSRTHLDKSKLIIVPNSIQVHEYFNKPHKNKDFLIGYISNYAYEYTVIGLLELIDYINSSSIKLEKIKFVIVGDGELLYKVKDLSKKYKLDKQFIFTGRINNVDDYLNKFDIGLIPWKKNIMSETILPTKLFEYMQSKVAIIAPNFGEFKIVLKHKENAYLYNSVDKIMEYIFILKNNKHISNTLTKNSYDLYTNKYKSKYILNKLGTIIKND